MILHNNAPAFWRRIDLHADATGARGEVSDNVHQFIVELRHDGETITKAGGLAVRVPWTTCPGAVGALKTLEGTSVRAGARVEVDQFRQCTHMLDVAKLAIAQISRGGRRTYDILVQSGENPETYRATIRRDGDILFEWHLQGEHVTAPEIFAGHMIRGRAEWSDEVQADPDMKEAALVLRRCVFVFRSRPSTKHLQRARDVPAMQDVCFSFQSERVEEAVRPDDFRELEL